MLCSRVVPESEEDAQRRVVRLHEVIILVCKQKADPGAEVGHIGEEGAVLPQEEPQILQMFADRCCWEEMI